jgi:hypothetical protein
VAATAIIQISEAFVASSLMGKRSTRRFSGSPTLALLNLFSILSRISMRSTNASTAKRPSNAMIFTFR